MLVNRVRKNQKRLKAWAQREGVSCYRLYDRDIPEIPLAIDWYEGRLHIAVFSGHAAPGEDHTDAIVSELARALEVPRKHTFVKLRSRQSAGNQYEKLSKSEHKLTVSEGGLRFIVNLSDYLDSGLFLDHRRTRQLVRKEARGKHFLNLFSYTGAFTVYAAAGGAVSTTSVDLSNTYLDWAEENMKLNGLAGKEHQFLRDDILTSLEHHRPDHDGYDLVVIDPPTISRSKGMQGVLDIQKDHASLINHTLNLCRPGAAIYFSTNYRKFRFRGDEIDCAVKQDITKRTLPFDFRDTKIHRSYRLEKT